MSLQTEFENMVAQRPAPNVPQMNPNASDLTRGLQVASFAMDTIGQVVRSERQAEVQQYQQKAQQTMQNVYQQTGSMQKAVLSANRVAQNVPAWARESVASSMSEFLGVFRMAQENDAIAQEARARKQQEAAARVQAQADNPILSGFFAELEGDENLVRATQYQVALANYNSTRSSSDKLTTEQFRALLEDPNSEASLTFSAAAGMNLGELAEDAVTLNVQTNARASMVRMDIDDEFNQIEQARRATENESELLTLATRSQHVVDKFIGLSTQVQHDYIGIALRAGGAQEELDLAARNLRLHANDVSNFADRNLPDNQKQVLLSRVERLNEMADILENQDDVAAGTLRTRVESLVDMARLGNPDLTVTRGLLGETALAETVKGVGFREKGVRDATRSMVLAAYGIEGAEAEEMTEATAVQRLEEASKNFVSGNASDADYNLLAMTSLRSLKNISEDGQIDEEELGELSENLLPVIFSSTILTTDTLQGRRNAIEAYNILKNVVDESVLSEDTLEIWTAFKGNSIVSRDMENTDLLNSAVSHFISDFNQEAPTEDTPRTELYQRRHSFSTTIPEWIDNEWAGVEEDLKGTIYEGVFETPVEYLSFLSQLNNYDQSYGMSDFYVGGRRALGRLFAKQGLQEQATEQREQAAIDVEILDQNLEEIVMERLARNNNFFGVSPEDVMETRAYLNSSGNPDSVVYFSMDKVLNKLNELNGTSTPPVETPVPMEDELTLDSPIEDQARAEMEGEAQVSIDDLEGEERESRIVELNQSATRVNDEVVADLRSNLERAGVPDDVAGVFMGVIEGEGGTGGRINPDSGAAGIFQYTQASREDAYTKRGLGHPDGRPYTAEEWVQLPPEVQLSDAVARFGQIAGVNNFNEQMELLSKYPAMLSLAQLRPASVKPAIRALEAGTDPSHITVLSGDAAANQAEGMQVRQPDGSVVVTVKSMNDYYSGNAR